MTDEKRETSTEKFDSPRDLAIGLGYDDDPHDPARTLEDFVDDYLDNDVGGDVRADVRDGLCISAGQVTMWVLEFPVTRSEFLDYLDVLDVRIGRSQYLDALPDVTTWQMDEDDGADELLLSGLAHLFEATETDIARLLGTDLKPVDCVAAGRNSHPCYYLQITDEFVVGLDEEFVHIFKVSDTVADLDSSDVVGWFEWDEPSTISLEEFAAFIQRTITRPPGPRGTPPSLRGRR